MGVPAEDRPLVHPWDGGVNAHFGVDAAHNMTLIEVAFLS
jgi:hypothetical protein